MPLPANDPRLKAAELTEKQFVGEVLVHSDNDALGLLDAYVDLPWNKLPPQALIEPKPGYTLHYSPPPPRLVYLAHDGKLVGVFHDDNLTIDEDHRGLKLSRELILAGFAQVPWMDLKNRKVTNAGEAALRGAHKYVREIKAKIDADAGK